MEIRYKKTTSIPISKKYPLFRNAKPVSDVVHPGETIFVPKGWWHTARSLEPSISIAQDLLTKYNWDIFERDVIFYKKKEGFVESISFCSLPEICPGRNLVPGKFRHL